MPVTTGRTKQIAVRITHEQSERLSAIAASLSTHSPLRDEVTTAEALRSTIAAGLDALEASLGVQPKPTLKPTKRGAKGGGE